jgi:hypothetical protein
MSRELAELLPQLCSVRWRFCRPAASAKPWGGGRGWGTASTISARSVSAVSWAASRRELRDAPGADAVWLSPARVQGLLLITPVSSGSGTRLHRAAGGSSWPSGSASVPSERRYPPDRNRLEQFSVASCPKMIAKPAKSSNAPRYRSFPAKSGHRFELSSSPQPAYPVVLNKPVCGVGGSV